MELKLGTRGSPLALRQAAMVAERLRAVHGWPEEAVRIVPFRTSGDRIQDRPLAEIGGKALFTKELDQALLEGRIDLAVHSMKDVETWMADGLLLAATLPRADVRDRLITSSGSGFADIPSGARLGTSSPRRAAQARHHRPDLVIVPFRGNVETRLARLARGEAEATLLAAAGLDRLSLADMGRPLPTELFLPAPAQGAIGIAARAEDGGTQAMLDAINDPPTFAEVALERALLAALGGSCRTPVAALARVTGTELHLRAELLSPDGGERHAGERRVEQGAAVQAAADLGLELKLAASPALRQLFGG